MRFPHGLLFQAACPLSVMFALSQGWDSFSIQGVFLLWTQEDEKLLICSSAQLIL